MINYSDKQTDRESIHTNKSFKLELLDKYMYIVVQSLYLAICTHMGIQTCLEFVSPGLKGSHHGNLPGDPVVQTLVGLTVWSRPRVVAKPNPQHLPWTISEVVAD